MALKDWKKVGKNTWEYNNKNGNLVEKIWLKRTKVPTSLLGTNESVENEVAIGYIIKGQSGKVTDHSYYYKTKSEALMKAKAYMRKN